MEGSKYLQKIKRNFFLFAGSALLVVAVSPAVAWLCLAEKVRRKATKLCACIACQTHKNVAEHFRTCFILELGVHGQIYHVVPVSGFFYDANQNRYEGFH